jgi:ankyrin repeat protein
MKTQEDQEQLNSKLIIAAEEGRVEEIKTLIKSGADFNAKDHNDETPLHHASKKGRTEAIITLISLGADFNAKNDIGDTPLHLASREGHAEAIRTLITLGADIDAKNDFGDTPLHNAALNRSTIALETLIGLGATIDAKNKKGETPLFFAAQLGRLDGVDTLIKLGADPYSVDNKGNTVLLSACSSRSAIDNDVVSIINLLSEKGLVDLHRVNEEGNNALHISATHPTRAKHTVKTIKTLVDLGVNVDAHNKEGKTPLHVAVSSSNNEGAKVLLDCKANPNLANENGITPLQIAVEKCNTDTIMLLLENGANTDSFPTEERNKNKTLIEVIALNETISFEEKKINFDELFYHGAEIDRQFVEDPNTKITDATRNSLRQLCDPIKIGNRNQELHNKYVASILNGDPLPRCNDFTGGVILQAIKSIKLDEIKDNSEIKKSGYYKLIELNKNIKNSDEIIKAIIKYPQEFEKLVETSSKLKATSKGITQGSQTNQAETEQTKVLFDSNLMDIILEKSLSPEFKKALGASDARILIDYLMEYKKNDSIIKRLDLVENQQNNIVSSKPSSTTQNRFVSLIQSLAGAFSRIVNDKQGGGRSAS